MSTFTEMRGREKTMNRKTEGVCVKESGRETEKQRQRQIQTDRHTHTQRSYHEVIHNYQCLINVKALKM